MEYPHPVQMVCNDSRILLTVGLNFFIASGCGGQTLETLALAGEGSSFERITGLPLKSYVQRRSPTTSEGGNKDARNFQLTLFDASRNKGFTPESTHSPNVPCKAKKHADFPHGRQRDLYLENLMALETTSNDKGKRGWFDLVCVGMILVSLLGFAYVYIIDKTKNHLFWGPAGG